MIVSSPMDEWELRNLMYTSQLENKGAFVIRYPRGNGVKVEWQSEMKEIEIGTARYLRKGENIAVISLGHVGNMVDDVCSEYQNKGINLGHIDLRFVKPIDKNLLKDVFENYDHIITIEDGCIQGGMGSAVLELMAELNIFKPITRLGIPDEFVEHGTQNELHNLCGYDKLGLESAIEKVLVKA